MKKLVLPPVKSCKINSSKGFTLAEILVSLMILGVIASLTIPSLIQNTQKKEEVVKIKKGLSMINQALSMNYSLTGQYLEDIEDTSLLMPMFKKRLSVVKEINSSNYHFFTTQDGLSFLFDQDSYGFNSAHNISSSNYTTPVTIVTKTVSDDDDIFSICSTLGTAGNLNGCYQLYCAQDRCIPSEGTAAIINSSDPTKVDSGS